MLLKFFVLLLGFVALSHAQQHEDFSQCGALHEQHKANAGQIAGIDEFPWLARVRYNNTAKAELKQSCLAVLISSKTLLTPAHCVQQGVEWHAISVVLGDWNINNSYIESDCQAEANSNMCLSPPQEYEIESIILHPEFSRHPIKNDIAVLRLQKPVDFSQNIQAICLPADSKQEDAAAGSLQSYENRQLFYSGWQRRSLFNESEETRKLKIKAKVISNEKCAKIHNAHVASTPSICALCEDSAEMSSGAVLMDVVAAGKDAPAHYVLVGLVSQGFPVCNLDYPDVFVRVDEYLSFIRQNQININLLKAVAG